MTDVKNDPSNRATGTEGVSVLSKVSALLELLAERQQATVAELADALNEPRSSVHRMVRQLGELGWVESAGQRGQLAIGLHLFRLGSGAVRRMDVRRAAAPHMRALNEIGGESVLLVVRRGVEAVCIELVEGLRVQSLALRLGGSVPLHVGAGPTCLLAWDEDAHREWLADAMERGITGGDPIAPVEIADIEMRLDEIRRMGYSISDRDVTAGIGAIGAPVRDFTGKVVAAVSVSGVAEAVFDPALNLADRVRDAAIDISFDMGFPRE